MPSRQRSKVRLTYLTSNPRKSQKWQSWKTSTARLPTLICANPPQPRAASLLACGIVRDRATQTSQLQKNMNLNRLNDCAYCANTGRVSVPFHFNISRTCPWCHPVTKQTKGRPVMCCGETDDFILCTVQQSHSGHNRVNYHYVSGDRAICPIDVKEMDDGFFKHPLSPQTWEPIAPIKQLLLTPQA